MTRGRFAPSPTGRMHLGNVFCALLSWLSAKSKGGEWVLRIEDLDPQRSKKDYALQLMDDLQWLGLPWDGEPVWQSQRGEIYEEYLQRLTDMGLTYPCYCTRADIMATQAPHETDGRVVYKGTCRPNPPSPITPHRSQLTVNRSPLTTTTRLIVPDCTIPFTDGHYGKHDINLAEHCGDYIIRRKDGAWAYQLAVVVDDALMGVTEIVRGRDLLLSSPQQIHLRNLLFQSTDDRVQSTENRVQMTDGLLKRKTITDAARSVPTATSLTPQTVPLRQGDERSGGGGLTAHYSPFNVDFFHHPLLCNAEGQRLCKRDKSMDLGYLRGTGITPQEIIGKLAYLAGLTDSTTPITPSELLPLFSWKKVPTEDIILK
ncbi:MAG: glutamyl-Q tRNA(Asp) synthetase [Bacteroidaceae bacterium]|nr:glutamyl-Q tRNA(Asp) synthetase [Bacteroidaceae bacterium]